MDSNSIQQNDDMNRKVRFDANTTHKKSQNNQNKFNPSHVTCTPSLESLKYKVPQERAPVVAPASSLVKPNYEDLLKRVAVVIHKHIITCENRYRESTQESLESGQFHSSMMDIFSEDHFISPIYVYHFTRVSPIAKMGFNLGMRKLQSTYEVPTLNAVHNFLYTLFSGAQLSAECSIVCLIYVERLMEVAHVPLMSTTWRPCVMCGLLLASKVWQDLRFFRFYTSLILSLLVHGIVKLPKYIPNLHCKISIGWRELFVIILNGISIFQVVYMQSITLPFVHYQKKVTFGGIFFRNYTIDIHSIEITIRWFLKLLVQNKLQFEVKMSRRPCYTPPYQEVINKLTNCDFLFLYSLSIQYLIYQKLLENFVRDSIQ